MDTNPNRGFTLIEVVVTAVIVAILAAVAIPVYTGYVNSARVNDARGKCEMVGAAVMQLHNRGASIADNMWTTLGVTDPSDLVWTYTFTFTNGVYNPNDPDNCIITATPLIGGLATVNFRPYQSGANRWPP